MRSSKSRSRSKSNRQRTLGNITNRVFDSSGPEGKVRGTPQQIIEKYLTLARDAQLSHDRVAEQSFLQHAEHYTRMLGEANREMAERQGRPDDDGFQSNIGSHGYHQGGQNAGQHNGGQNGNHGQQGDGNQRRDHQQRDGGQHRDQQRDGNYQQRDGQRDHQSRDNQPRENQPRDNQPRDNQRDSQPRENQQREQRPRSEPRPERGEQRQDPRPDLSEENAPQFLQQPSLPDVMSAKDDYAAAPVRTPEAEATPKPARTRTPRPRAPRVVAEDGTVPAAPTRSRRKPAVEAEQPTPVRPEGEQD
ncbi:DUF4167 domain-containing protein [Paracoccus sp. Ld10]|uniref:DUF4167 domain-containing protein n=1 Tax=Paracoccus sp. Ld10 TaxID=649158 RepID=UPI00386E4B78